MSWFGLTDGWYCIDVGAAKLLRYAGEATDPFDARMDYYVARLWEDLMELLPAALEPVPDDLKDLLTGEPAEGWLSLCDDTNGDALDAALWSDSRTLDLGYLTEAPRVRIWRTVGGDGDLTTVAWQSPGSFVGPEVGELTVTTQEFVAAVSSLHRELMDAMQRRIAALPTDLSNERLWDDHRNRAKRLGHAMSSRPSSNWLSVRRGARTLLAAKRDRHG